LDDQTPERTWRRTAQIATIDSPWVRLLAERWLDERGAELDYWRVERVDSVIVLPIWRQQILLPHPQFRPGAGRQTLDLPGGRVPAQQTPLTTAPAVLRRELGIEPAAITALRPLNERGWNTDSSFSNQRLFGVVATIDDAAEHANQLLYRTVACTVAGALALAAELDCLQCRAVLQEWALQEGVAGVSASIRPAS
jgi:hypothetical protein